MGIIVNPRGTSGSGKTELVRRLLAAMRDEGADVEPLSRPGRLHPIGYRVRMAAGQDCVVLGHYERTSGGCDTVTLLDGGLEEIFRLANLHADLGAVVLLEGALLSEEVTRSIDLARQHTLHILCLATSADICAANLVARRHARRDDVAVIGAIVENRRRAVADACDRLEQAGATVTRAPFDIAFERARALLYSHASSFNGDRIAS